MPFPENILIQGIGRITILNKFNLNPERHLEKIF